MSCLHAKPPRGTNLPTEALGDAENWECFTLHQYMVQTFQSSNYCNFRDVCDTVDGSEILHLLISSWSHYLQGFIHPRWCKISSINSMFLCVSLEWTSNLRAMTLIEIWGLMLFLRETSRQLQSKFHRRLGGKTSSGLATFVGIHGAGRVTDWISWRGWVVGRPLFG